MSGSPVMQNFTPGSALAGGALIGLATSSLLFFAGRIAGISGVVGGLLRPEPREWGWRAAFVAGLLFGGAALLLFLPHAIGVPTRSYAWLAVAGLLVGFGARLGRGCTSGHGVCGISRLSSKSIVATATFMATGIATVAAVRVFGGFGP
jgi:uncharacterized membrane protein YedE/YeeE